MSVVYDFLKSCGVFWVSTVNSTDCPSDNIRPACRPFGAVAEYSGHLYISTGNTKEVYKQFKDLPYIQITALKAETREWLRLDATAEERTALSEKKMMLENCPVLKKRFSSPDDPFFALFRLNHCRAFVHTDDGVKEI